MSARNFGHSGLLMAGALAGAMVIFGAQAQEMNGPQPMLPTTGLTVVSGGVKHALKVELAETQGEQEAGEMFRKSVPEGTGMLFDWHESKAVPMWMKNTIAPLDMWFLDDHGKITHIVEQAVPYSLAIIDSGGESRGVIEVMGGLSAKWNVNVGDKVEGVVWQPYPSSK